MKLLRSAFWFVFSIAAVCAPQAVAMSCAPHDEMLAWLKKTFREEVIANGVIVTDGEIVGIMETTVSHTRSWTVIATGKDNTSCIFTSGKNYDQQALKPGQGT